MKKQMRALKALSAILVSAITFFKLPLIAQAAVEVVNVGDENDWVKYVGIAVGALVVLVVFYIFRRRRK